MKSTSSWRPCGHPRVYNRFGDPAVEDDIVQGAEWLARRPLPLILERFVRATNGGEFFDGHLTVRPLFAGFDGGILDFADDLRNDGWLIADVLDRPWDRWVRRPIRALLSRPSYAFGQVPVASRSARSPSAANMALGGTDLGRYLRAVSAYYLVLLHGPTDALDVLDVPKQAAERTRSLVRSVPYRLGRPGPAGPTGRPIRGATRHRSSRGSTGRHPFLRCAALKASASRRKP